MQKSPLIRMLQPFLGGSLSFEVRVHLPTFIYFPGLTTPTSCRPPFAKLYVYLMLAQKKQSRISTYNVFCQTFTRPDPEMRSGLKKWVLFGVLLFSAKGLKLISSPKVEAWLLANFHISPFVSLRHRKIQKMEGKLKFAHLNSVRFASSSISF